MSLIFISFLCAVLYLVSGAVQATTLSGKGRNHSKLVMMAGAAAVVIHTYAVYIVLHPGNGIQLGFFPVSSLIAWLIAGLVLISSIRKPLQNLFVVLFPLAAIAVILAALAPATTDPKPYTAGIISHILCSILAYSVFSIAAVQALLVTLQDRQLRNHHTRGIVNALPPLQIMEKLLFEMLWTGQLLLSISLVTGILFIDDIFAQHLVHKTALSFVAWIIYAIMLWGRHQKGWRGIAAVRWTLGGFCFLMLAYFGSKFAVEILM
ncbi:MAG: cytochrome c biogenesis protein CcsA [Motiliproteus sp.]|nr:cytochrome c biogenesis protein CcsA [Motiliproteus sp.]MCW9052410.1 cytochrome c biogenesis protein CcsA [Motiliproteus sp.]